ncbi:MAG: hypothetical protein P8X55_05760 [Desulfosarcinaceae bacterium]
MANDGKPKIAGLVRLWGILFALLVGLPLAGAVLDRKRPSLYLEFPPLTRHVHPPAFSWAMFVLFAAIDLAMLAGMALLLVRAHKRTRGSTRGRRRPLPAWGWAGLLFMAGGWLLAWSRFPWFAALQPHTFCLPWLGYIVLVNALCLKRSRTCPLTRSPGRFALLFAASALFWWFFEYLNRYVQNWYYVGADDFGPLSYTIFASLAFATVLPAVVSTYALLLTVPVLGAGLESQVRVGIGRPRLLAVGVLLAAGAGLLLLGVRPDLVFGLVWLAPLLIILSVQTLAGEPTILSPLRAGDWRPVITAAVAALICGFFWEMWNIGSLARWAYAIPYVDRYPVFAMPILGYGGYLPFGLECLAIGQLVLGGPEQLEPEPLTN